jgi:hypothetical protein
LINPDELRKSKPWTKFIETSCIVGGLSMQEVRGRCKAELERHARKKGIILDPLTFQERQGKHISRGLIFAMAVKGWRR